MGAIGSHFNPPTIESPTLRPPGGWSPLSQGASPMTQLAQSQFQARTLGAGTGPDQLSERNWNDLINQALAQQAGVNVGQNALASSLQAQAAGTGGPNLAQQQLQNATNQNIQSQAGAVASLRGLNPAAAARLIAQQGANIQQQAAGQSAEARMQQQLAAQQQLGQLFAQQAAQNQAALGTGAGAQGQQNALNLQNVQGAQGINANTAVQNAQLKSVAQGQNLGLVDTGAQTAGGVANGLAALGAAALSKGGVVPGRTPFPNGDPRTDTVPALLAPGEVVVPATISDDPQATAAFVAAIRRHKAKHGKAA